ncbi:MAG: bifunctional serine/threonine-protein kinase/formylglycine-generating enzyme family protein [Acidobacteriota bacterium]
MNVEGTKNINSLTASQVKSDANDDSRSQPIRSGARIEKYEIITEIGKGGMGTVYKALHPHFKKYVAIKEIRSELANNPEVQQWFEQEVELLARLPPHPNIVMVRDALVWQGRLFLVMDYIEGTTLGELIYQGAIEPARALLLLDQILSGLAAIHERGIVHHDLKANNILIDADGTAYITDFGIAECKKINARSNRRCYSTRMATAKYAAPEVIDSSLARDNGEYQIDIYAIGLLAYEMLLGEQRFREEFSQIYQGSPEGVVERWLNWHTDLNRAARNLNDIEPQIPRPLARIVERLMAKNMDERYKSVNEARRDIDAIKSPNGKIDSSADNITMPLDQQHKTAATVTAAPVVPLPLRPRRTTLPPQPLVTNGPATSPAVSTTAPLPTISPLLWKWGTIASAALLAVVALILYLALPGEPGFLVIVRGAPPFSNVYIDNIHRGITAVDGSIRVSYLKSGKRLVQVWHEGYADFNSSVTGNDGEERSLIAELVPLVVEPSLPWEIEYTGPMILIPAGEFTMGDDNHLPNERPAHKVKLLDYYIDKFETTNAQYQTFCEATKRRLPANPWWDEQYYNNYPNAPVVGVSWNDAIAYAQWTGKRLISEAEWEKAASWQAKEGKKRQWPWGDTPEMGQSNLAANHPTSINQFPNGASSYGVQDMAGNAAEWVVDYYQPYAGNTEPDSDYGTINRVVRGGSFRSDFNDARTTRRFYHTPEFKPDEKRTRSWLIGFRCVVSADDPKLVDFLRMRRVRPLTESQ